MKKYRSQFGGQWLISIQSSTGARQQTSEEKMSYQELTGMETTSETLEELIEYAELLDE